jgi:Capsule assembly protein Wzi
MLVLIALCIASAERADAQHPLTLLPLDDPAYVQLGVLERLGCSEARIGPFRPFMVRDVRIAVRAAANDPECPALLVDALQRRFIPDTTKTMAVKATEIASRELVREFPTLSADSSRAPTQDSAKAAVPSGLDAGAEVTLGLTGLGKGEYLPLWRDVRPSADGTAPAVVIARGRLRWSGGPKFLAVSELYAQSNRRNDPTVRAKTVRQSSGVLDIGEAYANGSLGPIDMSFGRSAEAWLGQGRESFSMSAVSPMLDRLWLSGRWQKVQVRFVAALLDDDVLTAQLDSVAVGPDGARFSRGFVGHALTWLPTSSFSMTLGETMLFSRRGSPVDLAYLNPLVPIIVAQNDTGRTTANHDNLTVFGGARFSRGGAQLDAELFVDDIQVDAADRSRTASQLGWLVGGSLGLPTTQPTIVSVGYRRVSSFTYERPFYSDVYQYYNAPLGSELGPDADRLDADVSHLPNGLLRLSAGVSLWRHGATRIDRRPSEGPNDHAGLPFPSVRDSLPLVQRAFLWHLSAQVLSGTVPITASVEAANITNVNNQPSAAALYLRAVLVGSYAFRYP